MRPRPLILALLGLGIAAIGFFAGRLVAGTDEAPAPTLPAATLSKSGYRVPTLPAAEGLPALETTTTTVEVVEEPGTGEEAEVFEEPTPEPVAAPEKKEPATVDPEPAPAPDVTIGTTE